MGIKAFFEDKGFRAKIDFWGHCKVACAFLQGMSILDLSLDDLEYVDEDYQIIVTAYVSRID